MCLLTIIPRSGGKLARFPGVFFLFGRELGGGHGEEQKGARRILSRSSLASRLAPVPRTQRKNGDRGTGKRRETTGDLSRGWFIRHGITWDNHLLTNFQNGGSFCHYHGRGNASNERRSNSLQAQNPPVLLILKQFPLQARSQDFLWGRGAYLKNRDQITNVWITRYMPWNFRSYTVAECPTYGLLNWNRATFNGTGNVCERRRREP